MGSRYRYYRVFTFPVLFAQVQSLSTVTEYRCVVGLIICWVTIITKAFPGERLGFPCWAILQVKTAEAESYEHLGKLVSRLAC